MHKYQQKFWEYQKEYQGAKIQANHQGKDMERKLIYDQCLESLLLPIRQLQEQPDIVAKLQKSDLPIDVFVKSITKRSKSRQRRNSIIKTNKLNLKEATINPNRSRVKLIPDTIRKSHDSNPSALKVKLFSGVKRNRDRAHRTLDPSITNSIQGDNKQY